MTQGSKSVQRKQRREAQCSGLAPFRKLYSAWENTPEVDYRVVRVQRERFRAQLNSTTTVTGHPDVSAQLCMIEDETARVEREIEEATVRAEARRQFLEERARLLGEEAAANARGEPGSLGTSVDAIAHRLIWAAHQVGGVKLVLGTDDASFVVHGVSRLEQSGLDALTRRKVEVVAELRKQQPPGERADQLVVRLDPLSAPATKARASKVEGA